MTSARPAPPAAVRLVVGSVTFLLFATNTVVLCSFLYLVTLLKLAVPLAAWRRRVSRFLVAIGEAWIAVNTFCLRVTQPTVYDVRGLEGLRRDVSYLVVSNHLSEGRHPGPAGGLPPAAPVPPLLPQAAADPRAVPRRSPGGRSTSRS